MAKSLAQFVTDIRGYLAKGKLKPARKTLEKATKAGISGPAMEEVVFELLLAEGGGEAAAGQLAKLALEAESRLPAAIKHAEAHLRKSRDDHRLRDALWELCLARNEPGLALKHLKALLDAGAVDGQTRAQSLLARKDAAGAAGIFLLDSLGAIKTDRIKLADRMLANPTAAQILTRTVEALENGGYSDGPIHYVLAQRAQQAGDRDRFLEHAGRAFEEDPDKVWTWTQTHVGGKDRLEIALRQESLAHLLEASGGAQPDEILDVANRTSGESVTARTLRGLGLISSGKATNACRVFEGVIESDPGSAAPIAELIRSKLGQWDGAAEVFASVVSAGLASDPERVGVAVDALLDVGEAQRGDAWRRVAPRLLEVAPERDDLRLALGSQLLGSGQAEAAAALLTEARHLDLARQWAEKGHAPAPVLLASAELAEKSEQTAEHADWMLRAAGGDQDLLGVLGTRLSGSTVSADTALRSATALLDQGRKDEAAQLLSHLPLDKETGQRVDALLRERSLLDERAFQTASFRCALALGDGARAKRLFKSLESNVQALAAEASRHAEAGRVLADVLIGQEKGEVAVGLLDARREAGDDPRTLRPLADALLKASPRLSMGRLVRAKLLIALGRAADAVRDLRAIPAKAAELDEAFELLGGLVDGPAAPEATLGRADIHIARKQYRQAVKELGARETEPNERLKRYDTICRDEPDLSKAHRGRAATLLELGRIPESADAHLKRFSCADADRSAVATDLQEVARAALAADDLQTGGTVLEQLPDHVSDGAERAIGVIGEDQRAPLLILRSKLLLQLGRTEEAVRTLADLVQADAGSRAQAAEALAAIVESGQARPDADFALATAFDAMGRTPDALKALGRLYDDDITSKQNVIQAARALVVKADDPDVRLFLGRVCLDMRDSAGATEHAVHARRLRPAARRQCVDLLRHALDLDAFAPETHFALAEAHLAGDEADDAVRHFRAAVEVDRGRAGPAIAGMEEAAPRSKHPALLWLAVGTTYAEFLKDHARAVEAFAKGLDANPTTELRVPLLLGRGDSYAALREEDKAYDDFDEASHHDLLERRYYEYLRARHRKRVLEAAEAARENAQSDFSQAADAVGRFIRLGRAARAVEVAQAALAAAPDELGPRYLVGVALHAAGRYDAAVQALEAVRRSAGAGTEVGRAARMLLAESYLDEGDRVHARACLTEIEAVDAAYPGLAARRAALAPPADDPHAPPPLFVRPEFPRPTE